MGLEAGGEKAYGRRKVDIRVRATGCPARLGQMKGQLVKQKRGHVSPRGYEKLYRS